MKPLKPMVRGAVLGVALTIGAMLLTIQIHRAKPVRIVNRVLNKLGVQTISRKQAGPPPQIVTNPKPNWVLSDGYSIELMGSGYTHPVSIVFPQKLPSSPDSPQYYVSELGGTIHAVFKDKKKTVFLKQTLNYLPEENDRLTPQNGLMGLCYDPLSNGLLATINYRSTNDQQLHCRVLRLHPDATGRQCARVETIFDTFPEVTVPSHTIQQPAVGPDGKLYIPIGDAETPQMAQDWNTFAGSILRMELDGKPCADNPRFAAGDKSPKSYIYAQGFRNPCSLAWTADGKFMFATDVGPQVDRLVRVVAGMNHGWGPPATDDQMRLNAFYQFGENTQCPYGIIPLDGAPLDPSQTNTFLVALFGDPETPSNLAGRQIVQFTLNEHGFISKAIKTLAACSSQPNVSMHSPVCLAKGPDGVYFTDIFGDAVGGTGKNRKSEGTGQVWRIYRNSQALSETSNYEMIAPGWAGLSDLKKGEALFKFYSCSSCHSEAVAFAKIGPNLSSGELRDRVIKRITTPEYERQLKDMMETNADYKEAYQQILASSGKQRFEKWVFWRLMNPRFDNPEYRMPQFGFNHQEARFLVRYLADRDPGVKDY